MAHQAFGISESRYRCEPKLYAEITDAANWLLQLALWPLLFVFA
jgi:hypothetical protein